MDFPWDDNEDRKRLLEVETEEPSPADELAELELVEDTVEEGDEGSFSPEAVGVTSHVLACRSLPILSKSSFKPAHSTSAVWTRVGFYNA